MKEKMITRTIVSTNYTVMCVDIATAKVENRVYTFAGVKDESKCLAIINDLYKETTEKAVAVTSAEEVETLYGMPMKDPLIAFRSVLYFQQETLNKIEVPLMFLVW